MERKLKLIIKKIHWSLAVKSLFLSLSSLILPFFLFCFLALLIYFIPLFRPLSLIFQFLIFIFIIHFFYGSFWGCFIIFLAIYLILGVKDLIIIERKIAYEFLGYLLFSVLTLKFFQNIKLEGQFLNLLFSLSLPLFFILFFKNNIFYNDNKNYKIKVFKIGISILAFFIWQFILILNFLPLNFYLQTAILILITVSGFNFIFNYSFSKLDKKIIVVNLFIFIFLFSLILFLNHWGL